MSENVQFETDQQGMPSRPKNPKNFNSFNSPVGFSQPQLAGMPGWLIRQGFVKTEGAAHAVLGAIIIFNFLVAGVIVYLFVPK